MSVVLDVRALTRVHGEGPTAVHALNNVDLAVAAGELVAVMGPSGSGKSTLLTCAGGLDRPTSGEILVEGTDLVTLAAAELAAMRRRRIGVVFQDFNLIPALTAVENVALPLELDGVRARQARKQAERALAEVDIAELAERFPEEMSGGQRQRIAIARAIVGERKLLLADEPTGALDSETGETVLQLLRDRCDSKGIAVVLVTHEARHAAWADRVVYLRDGVLVGQSGPLPSADSLLATLAAVGAQPRRRRYFAAAQAWLLGQIGCLLGVGVGALLGYTTRTLTRSPYFAVPWLQLLGIVVLVPLFAAGLAWLMTRSRLPMLRRAE